MKLEQAIVYFEMGYDIARVEWEDGDFVRLIDLPETAIALVKVENGIQRNYAFSDEDKQADDWYATCFHHTASKYDSGDSMRQ